MPYTLYPTCYHETLGDFEIEQRECSDGIYVSVEQFGALMTDSDDMIVYRLRRGEREAYVHICGTHQGERYAILAPPWVCDCLDQGSVTMERAYPGIGTRIKIRPHTTEYADADDPVEVLQRAFEAYSCIAPGMELPLMVEGRRLMVDVLETNGDRPICIRGVELEVEIHTAASDAEAEAEAEAEAVAQAEADAFETQSVDNTFDFSTPMLPVAAPVPERTVESTNPSFPGRGHRLGT